MQEGTTAYGRLSDGVHDSDGGGGPPGDSSLFGSRTFAAPARRRSWSPNCYSMRNHSGAPVPLSVMRPMSTHDEEGVDVDTE